MTSREPSKPTKGRRALERWIESAPEARSLLQVAGCGLCRLGRAEDAEGIVLRLKELMPFRDRPLLRCSSSADLGPGAHPVGRYEDALEELDAILAVPAVVSIPWLELDPRWQPLREQPGFARLVETYGAM